MLSPGFFVPREVRLWSLKDSLRRFLKRKYDLDSAACEGLVLTIIL